MNATDPQPSSAHEDDYHPERLIGWVALALVAWALFFLLMLPAHAALGPLVELGASVHSDPEVGTWYDPAVGPYRFEDRSYAFGAGAHGGTGLGAWSVLYEDLGVQRSWCLVQGINYSGTQHPIEASAAWEPSIGPVLLQLGLAVYRPRFLMHIPDRLPGAPDAPPYELHNDRTLVGYLAGLGVRPVPGWDLTIAGRYVAANGDNTRDRWLGLGKFVFTAMVRRSF